MNTKEALISMHAAAGEQTTSPSADARKVRSEDLLCGRGELVIVHQGREYRLRLTQNGKLILTA